MDRMAPKSAQVDRGCAGGIGDLRVAYFNSTDDTAQLIRTLGSDELY